MSETATIEKTQSLSWQDQTFLVGEHVYLRSFVPGDEKNANSWRASIFPKSPELVEKWIKEELPKESENKRGHLAIVRKSDDTIVGNIVSHVGDVNQRLDPYVDPLYGEVGETWLAEAVVLVAKWQVDERFVPTCGVVLGSHLSNAVSLLLQAGFVQTACWREMLELNGDRYDRLSLAYFSEPWTEKLGHPMDAEIPRSGNGDIRPVPATEIPDGDPPKQAVMIGERVYLRPQDKTDAKHYVNGHRQETETFFGSGRYMITLAEWEEYISGQANEDFPSILWFEVCLRDTDETIGSVGLLDIDYVNRTAETGSHFYSADVRGKGYGSEAKHLLLEYAFNVLQLHMVTSFVVFPNTRSAAALRKQGYKEAGRVCWNYAYQGSFGNMVTFDLLAEEWRALPREA